MAKTIRCSIVTPSRSVFEDEVTYASFPAWDGQQGVRPGQSPLLTRLGVGTLRVDAPEGGSRWFLIDGGFGQIQNDELTLLTESAAPAESLVASEVNAELETANESVHRSGVDRAQVEHDQQVALAKKSLIEGAERRGRAI